MNEENAETAVPPAETAPGTGAVIEAVVAESKPPRLWTAVLSFPAAMVAGLAGGLAGMLIGVVLWSMEHHRAPQGGELKVLVSDSSVFVPSILMTELGLLGVTLLMAAMSKITFRARLRLHPEVLTPAGYALAMLGFFAFSAMLGALLEALGFKPAGALAHMEEVARRASPTALAALLLVAGALPGLCEELYFRGYLQSRLRLRMRPSIAVALTAIAFGLMHADKQHTPLAFAMGLYAGWLAERTGSIVPGIAGHGFNNMVAFLLSGLGVDVEDTFGAWPATIGCAVATVAFTVPLARGVGLRLQAELPSAPQPAIGA